MAISHEDFRTEEGQVDVTIPPKESLDDDDIDGNELNTDTDEFSSVEFPDEQHDKDQIQITAEGLERRMDVEEEKTRSYRKEKEKKAVLLKQVNTMLEEHNRRKISKGFKENEKEAWGELMEKAPTFNSEELKNDRGEIVDFDTVHSYQELIDKLEQEGEIVNQLGQRVPAETIINDIFKLTYQNIDDFTNTDWTKITLRHNLRKAVARLIREYKESPEFKMLGGLDWFRINTISGLKKEILKRKVYGGVNSDVLLRHIDENNLDGLPEMLKYRVQEIQSLSGAEVAKRSVGGVLTRTWRRVKSWFN